MGRTVYFGILAFLAFGVVVVLSYGFRHHETGAWMYVGFLLLIALCWFGWQHRHSGRSRP